MQQKIKLAVVGPGIFWNKAHKPALAGRDEVEICCFCASSEKRREQCLTEFPDAEFYTDYDNFLAAAHGCDAALIMAPIAIAADLVSKTLQAGISVVTEKPLAMTSEMAVMLGELARTKKRKLLVAEQHAYRPVIKAARQAIESGEYGRAVSFDEVIHFTLDENHPDGYGKTWRVDGNFPLGALFDGGVHNISDLSHIFGQCTQVAACGQSLREGYGPYDHVLTQLSFGNNVCGQLSHSAFLPATDNHFYIYCEKATLEIAGELLTIKTPDGQTSQLTEEPDKNLHEIMWDFLLDKCLLDDQQPLYSARDAARDIAILEAIDSSCSCGKIAKVKQLAS